MAASLNLGAGVLKNVKSQTLKYSVILAHVYIKCFLLVGMKLNDSL